MKLNIVPAGTGKLWVRLGIRTFLRQPLAMSGLFFLFMAVISVIGMIPYVGSVLSLTLLPAATLGLMAATRETTLGNFPMPTLLVTAFRAERSQARAMLMLGVLYAVSILLVLGISTLIDGGKFAKLYLMGGALSPELLQGTEFQMATLVALALYLPLSMAFWHAPALVHWHGVPAVKSLFFSLVACVRNFWAMVVYSLLWGAVTVSVITLVTVLGATLGGSELVGTLIFPTALLLVAMFFTSMYFTFRDSFDEQDPKELP
ncbi:MAG: hypothetical protein H7Y28_11070 [Rhodoferax sp.]|nr:hypothetical protein [Rhodoferax sp.]